MMWVVATALISERPLEMVYSASGSEYAGDIAAYDVVVPRLNATYGDDFTLSYVAGCDLGLRGLRIAAFGSVTDTMRHEDGTVAETTTDLTAEAAEFEEAGLASPQD